jgi:hypothetical protein
LVTTHEMAGSLIPDQRLDAAILVQALDQELVFLVVRLEVLTRVVGAGLILLMPIFLIFIARVLSVVRFEDRGNLRALPRLWPYATP